MMNITDFVCVKAVVYENFKTNPKNSMVVLFNVPRESYYGKISEETHPTTGTLIVPVFWKRDATVINIPIHGSLSAYERYLTALGWRYKETIPLCRKESEKTAFKMAQIYLQCLNKSPAEF